MCGYPHPYLQHWTVAWWRHQMETFSALLALCAGNSPVPVNFPHKGQWRGDLMFTLICARINDWVNNREAGDLRRHLDHYDVSVMAKWWELTCWYWYQNDYLEKLLSQIGYISLPYHDSYLDQYVNSSPSGQNGRLCANDIFICIFVNGKFCDLIHWHIRAVLVGCE